MRFQSMISDILWLCTHRRRSSRSPAGRGASQRELALWAGTQQSSISEYESRRKSPTLEVVERLLAVADFELAIKPVVVFESGEDSEIGQYVVPERLWSVPMPDCFSKIQVLGVLFEVAASRGCGTCRSRPSASTTTSGSSCAASPQLMLESVDGILLMQVWER